MKRSNLADTEITFFTISSESFFPGTVALLNSLRLTGNEGPLVILDAGLSDAQRARLEPYASIVDIATKVETHPTLFKAFPYMCDPRGIVVIIDSDIVVTRPLSHVVDKAARGKICVFPDHVSQERRWFREWETALGLKTQLRRHRYVNAGFIALSTQHWPNFLNRFWEVSQRIPPEAVFAGHDMNRPFWSGDQDALNALLMSEIPRRAVELLPAGQQIHPDGLTKTRVVDARTLECAFDGDRPTVLHYSGAPKAWDPKGWIRIRRDAYVRLFNHVVCSEGVPLKMEADELPMWLRPGLKAKVLVTTLDAVHRSVAMIRRKLPDKASRAVLRAKLKLTGPRRPPS